MSSSTHNLKPWTELVKLHADVESGTWPRLSSPSTSAPSRHAMRRPRKFTVDPDAFFAATYITSDLQLLLEEVLSSLAGKGRFNRVLKLAVRLAVASRTPSRHCTPLASRNSLNQIASCKSLPDPGVVDVAVFDGEKFTATGDKDVGGGQMVHTMWGWLAWQIGPKAFLKVKKHDADRVSPSGDEIKAMLEAEGRPVLLLLDEVLKYMERAAAVGVKESTLQRQAKDFIQNLTVEVSNSTNAVMVYSLQWSAREALGNVALLEELDKLTSRKDQVREPVTGDEVLAVVKRRLLGADPSADTANKVAAEYVSVVAGYWRARAETTSAKQDAEEQSLQLKSRMKLAYPFHPALIDVMNSRWTSVDGFQRTRGALRFLATCLHALKKHGGAKASLGRRKFPLTMPRSFGPCSRISTRVRITRRPSRTIWLDQTPGPGGSTTDWRRKRPRWPTSVLPSGSPRRSSPTALADSSRTTVPTICHLVSRKTSCWPRASALISTASRRPQCLASCETPAFTFITTASAIASRKTPTSRS